ncbi:hypothetical protein LGQ02_15880 [Bacillus shivajii]|nr:hypothetical protein [Bacillus shivajii]UCZ52310.1 hypothetical protein LGQ02_15880 [Bacillus shivajii]
MRGGRTGRPNAAHATGRGVLRGGRIHCEAILAEEEAVFMVDKRGRLRFS